MTVSLTSILLRSRWGFFKLSWMGLRISLQARASKGFIKMQNTGSGQLHLTASLWHSEADAKAFAHSGYHLWAMKQSKNLASEIRILSYEGDKLPSWNETRQLLSEKGRVLRF